jgi:MFS family permease
VSFLSGFAAMAGFYLTPQLIQLPTDTGFGLGGSLTHASLLMVPLPIGILVASALAGSFAARLGARAPMAIGAVVGAISLALLGTAHGSGGMIEPWVFLMGIGAGFVWASLSNAIVESVPSEQTGVATGVNWILRSIGGAVGVQLVATLIAGSLDPGAQADEGTFQSAYWLLASAFALAIPLSLAVPRVRRRVAGLEPVVSRAGA